ncbi:hypothetical protein [Streptomyces sp. NPDC056244]|uniref:SCO2400 family protein n=1 Tax=Streptomyces sp. NPDC056244 TaxID=3345762 RepID=UPI0035DC1CDA
MRVAPAPHNLRGAMDYCDQCRRHLNGALACAGCGTPAEVLGHQAPPPPGPHHSRRPGQGAGGEEDHGEYGDAPDGELVLTGHHPEPPEPVRRRKPSRRRKAAPRPRTKPRRARSKRGRRVLIATLGVVLALATLSLAELAMESSDPDRATTVKEETTVDFDGGPDDTERPVAPSDPGPAPSEESGTGGAGGTDGSASPGVSGAAGTGTSGEASASSSASPGEPGESGPGPSASGSPGPSDSAPGSPGPSGTTGNPTPGGPTTTAPAPPPPPQPDPEPTDSCWLFICF